MDADSTDFEGSISAGRPDAESASRLRAALRDVHVRCAGAIAVCLCAVILCYPRLGDRSRASALRQLEALTHEVDGGVLARTLARGAEQRVLSQVPSLAGVVDVPRLVVSNESERERVALVAAPPDVSSLEALARATHPYAHLEVRGPDVEALAASLRWRLDRLPVRERITLTRLRRTHAVGADAVALEARVEPARQAWETARAAHDQARATYFAMRDLSDDLLLRAASKKAMKDATKKRVAAWEQFEQTRVAMEAARAEYDAFATRAHEARLDERSDEPAGVLTIATLQPDGGKAFELRFPVPFRAQLTPSLASPPAALARLQHNPAWQEIHALTPQAAVAQLRAQVSWHLFEIELLGVRIGGVTVLEWLPLLLALMFWHLIRRCRAASRSYSPFGRYDTDLPIVGTGNVALDRALLIAPPTLLYALTCGTLSRLGAEVWIAVPHYILCIGLSVMTSDAVEGLKELRIGARQGSLLPMLPERMAEDTAIAPTAAPMTRSAARGT